MQRKYSKKSIEYTNASTSNRERMEVQCTKWHEDAELKELESVAVEWLTMVTGDDAVQLESDVEEGNSDDEKNEGQMFEDEAWNGIQDDIETGENEDYGSKQGCSTPVQTMVRSRSRSNRFGSVSVPYLLDR